MLNQQDFLDRQMRANDERQAALMASFRDILSSTIASQPRSAPSTSSGAPKIRMAHPDAFDGTPKTVETFINSCVNIFMAQPTVYPNAESCVRFALGFVKGGSATRWRDGLFNDIASGAYVFTSWDEFADRLRSNFGNPHATEDAQRQLKSIRQNRRTAQDFFIEFEELKGESGFCDAAVVFDLKQAIRADVREEANRRIPKPVTYAQWKQVIIQVDQDLRANTTDSSFFSNHPSARRFFPFANRSSSSTVAATAGTTPHTTSSAPPAPAPGTRAPTTALPDASAPRTCWRCGQVGHISRNCKAPKKLGEKARVLLEQVEGLDNAWDTVRKMLDDEPDDDGALEHGDNDDEFFSRVAASLPSFFVESDE